MKILDVENKDFDVYGDWLEGKAAMRFIAGGYTHVCVDTQVVQCEVLTFDDKTQGVSVCEDCFILKYKTGDRFKAMRDILSEFPGNPRLYTKGEVYAVKRDEKGNYLTRSDEGEMTYISQTMLDCDFILINNLPDNFDDALNVVS